MKEAPGRREPISLRRRQTRRSAKSPHHSRRHGSDLWMARTSQARQRQQNITERSAALAADRPTPFASLPPPSRRNTIHVTVDPRSGARGCPHSESGPSAAAVPGSAPLPGPSGLIQQPPRPAASPSTTNAIAHMTPVRLAIQDFQGSLADHQDPAAIYSRIRKPKTIIDQKSSALSKPKPQPFAPAPPTGTTRHFARRNVEHGAKSRCRQGSQIAGDRWASIAAHAQKAARRFSS